MTSRTVAELNSPLPGDQLIEVVDELPLPAGVEAIAVGDVTPPLEWVFEVVCDAAAATEPLPLKTYTILTRGGPAPVVAQGHVLEAEADLFRLYKWENGRKNCVGLFDRREVIGLFEVPAAAPPSTTAA
jgi:hypothetical protein